MLAGITATSLSLALYMAFLKDKCPLLIAVLMIVASGFAIVGISSIFVEIDIGILIGI